MQIRKKYISFESGDNMPMVGLGTWKSEPGEVYQAVKTAIEVGYRHIDCAAVYGNEAEIGRALRDVLKEGTVDRRDLWITSKLWNNAHLPGDVAPALNQTLKDLNLEYLDLYLMHWPIAFKSSVVFPQKPEDYLALEEAPLQTTWKAMESLRKEGFVRHLGVSNFNIDKLKTILDTASIPPEMNQIENHPFLPQHKLVEYCKSNGIQITAYSPLGSGDRSKKDEAEPVLLEDQLIKNLSEKYDVSPAQIILAWQISRGISVIPKSTNPSRIEENLQAVNLEIAQGDLDLIEHIETKHRYIDGSFFTKRGSPYTLDDLWEGD